MCGIVGISILPRPANPPLPTMPGKGGGAGMEQNFSPAPWGKAGMGLDFLDPPRPALLRVIIVNFPYPKILLFK